ncbi:hypothetical protein DMP17_06715 [Pseudonocardia sp. TMWB2A]|uniref:hypothetical protein n=1 Tax=Pseudonocardia sp. TMWB2A TaxID=687430 RepID=UPI00307F8DE5
MTDQNRTNQEKNEAVQANAGHAEEEGKKDKARLDAEAARADEKAKQKDALTKKAESRELDRELDDSMDGSDPPSITQP